VRRAWRLPAILAAALAARLLLVLTSVYLWDEDREWIRLASSISFDPRAPHLPLQGYTHPVLPAYFMHLGSVLLGENPLGFRFFSLVAGVLTVLVAYRIGHRVGGEAAGAVAAAALALGEYPVMVSAVAVDMAYYLLFSLLAIGAFLRFLERPSAAPLMGMALATGAGYLCNERAGLLVPVFGVALLLTGNARWLLRWPTWAACGLFLLVVSPDLAKGWLDPGAGTQASHTEHLGRIAGLGLTAQPFAFFGKEGVRWLLSRAGIGFKDWAPEYPSLNGLLGVALLAGAAVVLGTRRLRAEPAVRTLLALLATVLGVLACLDTRYNEAANLAPQAWYWADLALLPAALLAGIAAARTGWAGRAVTAAVLGGCLLAGVHVVRDRLGTWPVKAGASPGALFPADGREVEVRVGFLPCYLCDVEAVTLQQIRVRQGKTWRAPLAGEVTVLEPDGRRLALRASPEVALYALQYAVRGRGRGLGTAVTGVDVVVRDAPPRYPPMFWLERAAQARGRAAPSPPRAGGS
jgi:hypothetical protein